MITAAAPLIAGHADGIVLNGRRDTLLCYNANRRPNVTRRTAVNVRAMGAGDKRVTC
jgi:hypothetical protein